MYKGFIERLVTRITSGYKDIFSLKTEVNEALDNLRTSLRNYADQAARDAVPKDGASTSYVDSAVQTVNNRVTNLDNNLDNRVKTLISSFGNFVGSVSKFNDLDNLKDGDKPAGIGDMAHLTANDGGYKKGLYKKASNGWVFISGDPTTLEVFKSLKYISIDDSNDDKFITGKWIKDYQNQNELTQEEVNNAINSAF